MALDLPGGAGVELSVDLLVLGGGPIGCELAQAFARLGAQVTIVEMADRLLLKEERQAGELIRARLEQEGVRVLLGARATGVGAVHDGYELTLDRDREPVGCERVLVATGRRPRTAGLGLEPVGVELDEQRAVGVDARLRTSARRLYAVGDVTGLLPFTDSEVARVGLTEDQACEHWGERVQVAEADYSELDRALAAGEVYGFAKLIGDPKGRLVGATVCAPAGGEQVAKLTAWIAQHRRLGVRPRAPRHPRAPQAGARWQRDRADATRARGQARRASTQVTAGGTRLLVSRTGSTLDLARTCL